MSAEVVKKRGRPKKVIPDLGEVDIPEVKKKTTRAKSTKAAPKPTKTTSTASAKPIAVPKSVSSQIETSASPVKAPKAAAPPKSAPLPQTPVVKAEAPKSKILEQVRDLEAKKIIPEQVAQMPLPPKIDPRSPPTAKSSPVSTTPAAKTNTSPGINTPNTKAMPSNPAATPPPPPKPTSKPHIPLAALNSDIVSNISTRAGARPNASGSNQLPKNYKSVSNKVTMVLVALPIAICTSYVLWQRLVMGEERKELVPPPRKDSPNVDTKLAAQLEPSNAGPSS